MPLFKVNSNEMWKGLCKPATLILGSIIRILKMNVLLIQMKHHFSIRIPVLPVALE